MDSGIRLNMSASRSLSIAPRIESLSSLARRYLTISLLLGAMDRVAVLPASRISISPRICGLPVINTRVLGDLSRTCLSELRMSGLCSSVHSSRASRHRNDRCEGVIVCNILTISESCSPRPPITLFWSSKACTISAGKSLKPLTTCLRREPSILVGDCSFWEAKSK